MRVTLREMINPFTDKVLQKIISCLPGFLLVASKSPHVRE